jgi:hypothetical protein
MDYGEKFVDVDWLNLAGHTNRWKTLEKTVMKFWCHNMQRNFFGR